MPGERRLRQTVLSRQTDPGFVNGQPWIVKRILQEFRINGGTGEYHEGHADDRCAGQAKPPFGGSPVPQAIQLTQDGQDIRLPLGLQLRHSSEDVVVPAMEITK